MTVRLDGKVALVTGGISGIGLGIARTLMERGASVVAMARREATGREVEAALVAEGLPFSFVAGDVASGADCERAVAHALERHDKLDILINNAATTLPTPAIEQVTEAEWDRTLDPNLKGAFLMTKAVLPHMKGRHDGVIINIASFAGVQGLFNHGPYGASKAGLIHFTKITAVECFGTGVRANVVVMGSVATEGNARSRAEASGGKWKEGESSGGVFGQARMQPEDAGRAICVLCSDDAREITGSEIAVDRGFSAGWMSATLIRLAIGGQLPEA